MAKLHKIKFPGTPAYDLEDQGALHFLGHTTTALTDGSTTATITIGGQSVTAVANDYVTANADNNNFIFNGTSWTCIDASAGPAYPCFTYIEETEEGETVRYIGIDYGA